MKIGKRELKISNGGKVFLACVIVIAIVFLYMKLTTHQRPAFTCRDLKAQGKAYIKVGSPDYNAAMDVDRDGIACES